MTELARAEVTIGGNDTPLQNALARSARSMQQTGRKMQRIGRRMSATVTAPLVGLGAAALKMSSDFEQSMTKIQTLVGLSAESVADMRRQILDLAPAVGRTPQELSRALFAVTSAGARGAEAMDILERSARAAAAGLGDTTEIARATVAAMTAFEDQGLTAAQAGDVLVATVREGNLEARDLAGSLGRVLGPAAAVGASFAEVGAFIAAFTRVGVSSEEAVTSLTSALNLAIRPTNEARQAMQEAGFSVDEFRRAIEEDGIQAALAGMVEATEGNLDVIGEFIPNVRALRGILATAGAQGEEYARIADSITNSQGILNKAFEDTQGTTAQTFAELKAQAAKLAIVWGDDLAPTFSEFLKTLGKVVEVFTSLPKPMRQTIAVVAGVTAAIGPLVLISGSLVRAVAALSGGFATLAAIQVASAVTGWASAFGALAVQVRSLSGALALLQVAMGPAGWIIAGATIITGLAVKHAFDEWGEAAEAMGNRMERAREKMDALVEASVDLSRQQRAQLLSSLGAQATALEQQLAAAQRRLEVVGKPLGDPSEARDARMEVERLKAALDDVRDAMRSIQNQGQPTFDIGITGLPGAGGAGGGGDPSSQVDQFTDAVDGAVPSVSALETVMGTAQQVARAFGISLGGLPASLTGLADGARRSFDRFRDLTDQMLRVRAANERIKQDARKSVSDLASNIQLAKIQDQLRETQRVARDFASSFTDAFMSIIDGSKGLAEAFGDMIQSLIADMARAMIQKQLFNLVFGLMGGGIPDAPGPIPEPQAPNFAGGFAHGGRIPSGSFGVVGESGPELVSGPARVTPASEAGSTVNVHQEINFTIPAIDQRGVNAFFEANKGKIAQVVGDAAKQSTGLRKQIVVGR